MIKRRVLDADTKSAITRNVATALEMGLSLEAFVKLSIALVERSEAEVEIHWDEDFSQGYLDGYSHAQLQIFYEAVKMFVEKKQI